MADWDVLTQLIDHFGDRGYTAESSAYIRDTVQQAGRIMVLGAGNGKTLLPLRELSEDIVVVDASWDMSRLCVQANGFVNVTAWGHQLPLQAEQFDVVIAQTGIVDFVEDTAAIDILREFYRVCKPGGYVFIGHLPSPAGSFPYYYEKIFGDRSYRRFILRMDNWRQRIGPLDSLLNATGAIHPHNWFKQIREDAEQRGLSFASFMEATPGFNKARSQADIAALLQQSGWHSIDFWLTDSLILANGRK
jgi:ubiquinone/menaquinone biosynthesis C-methylase UbiE